MAAESGSRAAPVVRIADSRRCRALDASRFCPIESDHWGYTGTLTLFDPPAHLDRIEITQTTQPLAMGRFYDRRGESVYMCYAETENTAPIVAALEERGARYTAGREDGGGNIFIHPPALCGMLMGISRTNLAWTWSGRCCATVGAAVAASAKPTARPRRVIMRILPMFGRQVSAFASVVDSRPEHHWSQSFLPLEKP